MFTDALDKSELRQGDIISPLWYPRLREREISLLGAPTPDQDEDHAVALVASGDEERRSWWFSGQVMMCRRFAMVLSQCCDVALDHGKMRGVALVLAPLFELPDKYLKPDRLERFRQNAADEYINSFYVEQRDPLPRPFYVDFARVMSIPSTDHSLVLGKKVLQLEDSQRRKLKTKIALHFGRLTPEEEAEDAATPSTEK
jgi:hypothetical protein